jgi:exosortase B
MSAVNSDLPASPLSDLPRSGGAATRETSIAGTTFGARWWPLAAGLAVLFASTSYRFATGIWQQPEFEHGPMMLAIALWLLWRERAAIYTAQAPASFFWPAALIVTGLLAYLLGVRLKAAYVEGAALVPVLAGALLLVGGARLVRRCAMALTFVLIATPLPAPVVFAATLDLKELVSNAAEFLLHIAGYPVARDGVTLRVGPYNLLMADACSGMNSLISLSAVGLLYTYLTARRSAAHMFLLIAAILPVAVATNLVRVLILVLITYHLGDEAGQGFLHEFAGFVMFLVALLGLALIDFFLGRIFPLKPPTPAEVAHHAG